ncbi:hypothetical protein ACFE04_020071 [Oxalis oulophora]
MEKTLGSKQVLHLNDSKNEEKYAPMVPRWLIVMYKMIFFSSCMVHENAKKNELDRFCIDCLCSFCSHCIPTHSRHRHVKIRRYVYRDVINREDLSKLFNCSGIQSYHTNKTKVLFLKQRYQQQPQVQQQCCNSKYYSSCIVCDRSLQDNSLYCSIACKVLELRGNKYREDYAVKRIKEEDNLTLRFSKGQRLRQSRKGVPFRAPMF